MDLSSFFRRASWSFAFGAASTVLFSIALTNILMALALASLLLSGERLRFPPIHWPLAAFFLGTLISLVAGPEPSIANPQIRKFFVFLMLVVASSAFRDLAVVRRLALVWAGIASLAALRSFIQFSEKLAEARRLGRPFYEYYVGERTTGFMSHWMTFGGQQMIVLLMIAALLFWAPLRGRTRAMLIGACGLIGTSIVLGMTRGIWLGAAAGALYLLWHWKRWTVLALPVIGAIAVFAGPSALRERVMSVGKPKGELDSNMHRVITWRTGVRMIQAHPLLGLGPEQVNKQFRAYLPPDVPQPLPAGWYGHLHNIYLHYAAERGIPTMLALLWLLGKVVWDFRRALPTAEPHARAVLHGAVAVIVAILVTGIFELNLGDSEVLMLFLVIVSAGYLAAGAKGAAPDAA
ncbi:MAG: O-antigen ligase family protein [Bryobacteraceae bacterium]|nr:O-antigen ligase family protein [Bryobacteraceae bacterium]